LLRRVTDFDITYVPPKRSALGRVKRPGAARIRVNSSTNAVRVWLFATDLDTEEDYRALMQSTEAMPLLAGVVAKESVFHQPPVSGRHYWLFQHSCYFETEGLEPEAVRALLIMRQRRQERQVDRAKSYAALASSPSPGKRQAIPTDVKILVWERDSGQCVRCGATTELQFDHVIPVALGGGNSPDNLQVLCGRCNRLKRDTID
jgi:5-methylcytosine-specific restriction endonuclease McrA